jgi:hypothetical protein
VRIGILSSSLSFSPDGDTSTTWALEITSRPSPFSHKIRRIPCNGCLVSRRNSRFRIRFEAIHPAIDRIGPALYGPGRIASSQIHSCGTRDPDCLSYTKNVWRYRLTVRTEPSQGLNTGSIPVSATNSFNSLPAPGRWCRQQPRGLFADQVRQVLLVLRADVF